MQLLSWIAIGNIYFISKADGKGGYGTYSFSGKIEGIVTADDRIAQLVDGNSHPDMAANRICKIFLALV